MSRAHYDLAIDPDFRRLIYPLSLEELASLETAPRNTFIRVWNDIVLVDLEIYEYFRLHNRKFHIQHISFNNRTEAVIWICRNQLSRKSLSQGMRRYLLGVLSLAERTNSELTGTSVPRVQIRSRIADTYSLNPGTIQKYEVYTQCIDYLEDISPAFTTAILSDRLKISQERIEALTQQPIESLPQKFESLMHPMSTDRQPPLPKLMPTTDPPASIKDMPDYDPDAELSSLALTIPAWIGSIDRVIATGNLSSSTSAAKKKVSLALTDLVSTADNMLCLLEENSHG